MEAPQTESLRVHGSSQRVRRLGRLARSAAAWVPGVAAYGAILVLVRLPDFLGKLLFLDDYGLLVDPFHDFTTGRFPLVLEMALVEGLAPGFSLSGGSQWLAALYLALAAEAIRRAFTDLGFSKPVAALSPVPFLVHPCTNELATWAVTRATGLCLFLGVQGYRVLREARRGRTKLGGGAMVLAGGLGYEVSLLVPVGLAVAEGGLAARGGAREAGKALGRSALPLVLAVAAVLLVKAAWSDAYPAADPRVSVVTRLGPSGAVERLKVASNVMSNVYLSPLAFYLGFEGAGRAWKWIPLAVPVLAFLSWRAEKRSLVRAVVAGAAALGVLVVSVLPALLLPAMNVAWRIAVPGTIAFALALALAFEPLAGRRRARWLAPAALVAVAIALVAPTRYHLDRRARCAEIESAVVVSVRGFWSARGIASPRYGIATVLLPDVLPLDPVEDERVLTEGFVPVTTSSFSTFRAASPEDPGWFVEQYLVHFQRLGVLDGDRYLDLELPADGPGIHRQTMGFLSVAHDETRRLTVLRLADPARGSL